MFIKLLHYSNEAKRNKIKFVRAKLNNETNYSLPIFIEPYD